MARGGGRVSAPLALLLAERDCTRLVARYAASADARDGRMASLFTCLLYTSPSPRD